MADRTQRREGNVPGKFYIDQNCIGCGLCWITARDNIRDDGSRRAVVFKQPQGEQELAEVYEAIGDCPEQSVGDDGEE